MKVKKLYKVLDNEANNQSNPISEIGDGDQSSSDSAYSSQFDNFDAENTKNKGHI